MLSTETFTRGAEIVLTFLAVATLAADFESSFAGDAVADFDVGYVLADFGDDARELVPDCQIFGVLIIMPLERVNIATANPDILDAN